MSMKRERITALGDSLTKGVVFTDDDRYSVSSDCFISILERTWKIKVDNYAKFGCTVDFGDTVIDRHSDVIADSDITLVEYGGNDCDFNWKDIAESPEDLHSPRTILENFRNKFRRLVDRISELGSKPVIITLPPIDSVMYFDFICRFMNERQRSNIMKWLNGDVEAITRWHESYNRSLFEMSAARGISLIDVTTPFGMQDIRKFLCKDGIHPNADGHRLIAETILNSNL